MHDAWSDGKYLNLEGKPYGKRLLGRQRRREDNIKDVLK
jgi:hypothetical protein